MKKRAFQSAYQVLKAVKPDFAFNPSDDELRIFYSDVLDDLYNDICLNPMQMKVMAELNLDCTFGVYIFDE